MYILYKVKLRKQGCNYRMEPDECYKNFGAKDFYINAGDDAVIRLLRRVKASDDVSAPRSKRFLTYRQILNSMTDKGYYLYIFAHRYPKDQTELNKLLGE